ncbi:MAG: hypothetical protein PHG85_04325 [Candidatus Altiarchaeota archaeon]|nr:hypothetical protein [Candidatus Altiarchaeota archaeon]
MGLSLEEKIEDLNQLIREEVVGRDARNVQFQIFYFALLSAVCASALVASLFKGLELSYISDTQLQIKLYAWIAVISSILLTVFWKQGKKVLKLSSVSLSGTILKDDILTYWRNDYQPNYEGRADISIIPSLKENKYTLKIEDTKDDAELGKLEFNITNKRFELSLSPENKELTKFFRKDFEKLQNEEYIKITVDNMEKEV